MSARFRSVTLLASDPPRLITFYRDTLELPCTLDGGSLLVRAGESEVRFDPAPAKTEPVYHFAFNVCENLIEEALTWLRGRTRVTQDKVFHFESWNAHSIYFFDPAGNILEFIARHSLTSRSAGPFSAKHILSVSEVGWVVKDVPAEVRSLQHYVDLEPYGTPSEDFAAVGDEEGLLIVVQEGREWFASEGVKASDFPVLVETADGRASFSH